MGLTKFLKIVFKRISNYIKDKVKFLKISFNLYVMRLGLSHEKKHTKVNDEKTTESNSYEIVLGEGDSFPPFPYKPFLL